MLPQLQSLGVDMEGVAELFIENVTNYIASIHLCQDFPLVYLCSHAYRLIS